MFVDGSCALAGGKIGGINGGLHVGRDVLHGVPVVGDGFFLVGLFGVRYVDFRFFDVDKYLFDFALFEFLYVFGGFDEEVVFDERVVEP